LNFIKEKPLIPPVI